MHSGDDSDGMSGVVAKVAAVGRKWYRCKCKFGKSRPIWHWASKEPAS